MLFARAGARGAVNSDNRLRPEGAQVLQAQGTGGFVPGDVATSARRRKSSPPRRRR
jgi:hypothetical protein